MSERRLPPHTRAWIELGAKIDERDSELREMAQRAPRGERRDLLSRAAELDEVREMMDRVMRDEDEG